MAYDKNEIFERAKKCILEDKEIVFVEDLVISVGVSKTTFYELMPNGSDEMDILKEMLLDNKSALKKKLRNKWYDSENATLNVCAYKLLSNDEERRLLADKQETTVSTSADLQHAYLEFMKNIKPSERSAE